MSYVQLVLYYLAATVMWLAFVELWSRRSAMILWWTLATSLLKDTIVQNFNQWYKQSMVIPALSKKNREKALVYYAAREFVHLNYQQKFNVGFQMGLADHYDAMRTEEDFEDYIFGKVVRNRDLNKFIATVRRVKDDDGQSR